MRQSDETLRKEHAALRLALELLGFNSNQVIAHLQTRAEPLWKELPFRLTSVAFDSRKAAASGLGEHGQRSVDRAFNAMRN
ncbi:hypothetical protein [Paraburkholderia phenazinium]|jgi:hypothetical protein|uniref:Uncharacterized protein n=1 Tax=Paraburkholderia phenazinium TaxID=60549 RepID=A0A1G7TX52_9BURK|nr:hypothetical protein [Paraburkholderia phenazinium]SDG39329.1 hypothetical protein SAMN05216466_103183 [Paraburkholderia phenazinium]